MTTQFKSQDLEDKKKEGKLANVIATRAHTSRLNLGGPIFRRYAHPIFYVDPPR
jgi:hypothetical protein